jgi:hypothetical protein
METDTMMTSPSGMSKMDRWVVQVVLVVLPVRHLAAAVAGIDQQDALALDEPECQRQI